MSLNLARKNISSYQTQKLVMFLHSLYFVSWHGFEETKQTTQPVPRTPTQCPLTRCHLNLASSQHAR